MKTVDIAEQPPPPDPRPQHDDGPAEDSAGSTNLSHTITNANSFGVFREYFTLSSHNPRSPDAFADVPMNVTTPQPQSIGSSLAAIASDAGSGSNPLTDSKNLSEDLILAWMASGSGNTPAGVNDLIHNAILHPDFDRSDLKGFNAVTAIRRFEREHFSKPGKCHERVILLNKSNRSRLRFVT